MFNVNLLLCISIILLLQSELSFSLKRKTRSLKGNFKELMKIITCKSSLILVEPKCNLNKDSLSKQNFISLAIHS